ncbi:MAG TPA: hypothetical protein VMQ93_03780, partial [Novosphingobium sp.]|nr:hypothetical protein [Novosphingobium sp.]
GGFMVRLQSALLIVSAGLLGSTANAADVAAPTKAIQLSKVIINPDIPAASQRVKVGTVCLFSGPPLAFGAGERTLNLERFERIFEKSMTDGHFTVVAKASNMFEGEGNTPGAAFLVGATLGPQQVNICDSIDGQKGTIAVSVEWQLYDRDKHEVVETVTTEGTGQVAKFDQSGLGVMFDAAFTDSLAALIQKGVLQKYVGLPGS